MKKIFRTILLGAATAMLGAALYSCDDVDDLEDRVDALENRVTALETQISALNSNIETLSTLLNTTTIYSITEADGVYTITTTSGETMTITQGAVGNTPLLSVDSNGYWIVSYDNGTTYTQILVDGSPVMASTVYPQFSVDTDGYWLVSYDGGTTYENVLDTSGNKVTALGTGSDLFNEVSYSESTGILTIVLSDGYTVEIVVTPEFLCSISDVTYSEPVQFEVGVTRTFNVTMRGVSSAFVIAPSDWSATLGDPVDEVAVLTVTPPSTLTKAVADSDSDLSIFAVSSKGYSTIAKMQVYATEEEVPASPSVTVTTGTITSSSIEFTITANADVTSWRYYFQASSLDALTDPDDFSTDSFYESTMPSVSLTFGQLDELTSYTIYVLPIHTDGDEVIYGDIVSESATTLEIEYDTYYEKYMAGKDIVIGDRTYNYATYGEPTLITESQDLSTFEAASTNIVFVNPDLTLSYTYSSSLYKLIMIGNNPDKKSTVTFNSQIKLNHQNLDDAEFVLYNIDMDASSFTNYLVAQNKDGAFDYFALVNCHISTPSANSLLFYISSASRYLNTIYVADCVWSVTYRAQAMVVNVSGATTYDSITFKNNVFYSTSNVTDFRLFSGTNATVNTFVAENNTFVNIATNGGIVRYNSLSTVTAQKNLFYTPGQSSNYIFFRPTDVTNYTGQPTGTICYDNLEYKAGASYSWQWFFGGISKFDTTGFTSIEESATELDDDPFTGGTLDLDNEVFTPASAYSGYGAQL